MTTFLDLLQQKCKYIKDCDNFVWKIDYDSASPSFLIWSAPAKIWTVMNIGHEMFQSATAVTEPDRKTVKKYQFVYRNCQGINLVSERFLSMPEADTLFGLDCAPLLWTEVEV